MNANRKFLECECVFPSTLSQKLHKFIVILQQQLRLVKTEVESAFGRSLASLEGKRAQEMERKGGNA